MDFEPGSRLKGVLSKENKRVDAVVGNMDFVNENMPDNPGPAALGRTPAVGSFRRKRDLPVIRDEIGDLLD